MEIPLRNKIKLYVKKAQEIEEFLSKDPNTWGKFQNEFNSEVNGIFCDIMDFEKINLAANREDRVYRLKQLFVNRIRKIFVKGVYIDWSLRKPFGYAGDFKIIEDIYENNPITVGFDRLFDNYFQMSAISIAVRNRKEDFKRLITSFICNRRNFKLNIMNLACGPCRELREILFSDASLCEIATFDCYDNDERALEYAKSKLDKYSNINFIKENAIRIALKKNPNSIISRKYDLIYATGLLDYFNEKVAIRLIRSFRNLLKPEGVLAISNVRDKYSNPSVHFMEWVGDWYLVYRDEDSFRKIFIEAGFKESELKIQYEQQGIMQYIITSGKR